MVRRISTGDLDRGETGELEKCPRCDRKVVKVRKYKNGDKIYIHEERVRDRPIPHIEIVEACYIKEGIK